MKEWVDPGADVLFPLEAKPPVRVALGAALQHMLAAVFGAFPTTSFSQNNGVIQLTGVASRRVGLWIALFLVVAVSLGAGLAVTMEPRLLAQFPDGFRQLFGSGIMTGTVAAVAAQALAGRD